MDNYNYDDNDDTRRQEVQMQPMYQVPVRKKDSLATISLVFGILSLFSGMTVWFGIIFAVISIVCAIISKLNNGRWDTKAVIGLSLGISGLVLSLLMFFMVISMLQNPEFVEQMNEMMQQYEQQYKQIQ